MAHLFDGVLHEESDPLTAEIERLKAENARLEINLDGETEVARMHKDEVARVTEDNRRLRAKLNAVAEAFDKIEIAANMVGAFSKLARNALK